jgi:hypothetical protein
MSRYGLSCIALPIGHSAGGALAREPDIARLDDRTAACGVPVSAALLV